jgi:hypothetical protein
VCGDGGEAQLSVFRTIFIRFPERPPGQQHLKFDIDGQMDPSLGLARNGSPELLQFAQEQVASFIANCTRLSGEEVAQRAAAVEAERQRRAQEEEERQKKGKETLRAEAKAGMAGKSDASGRYVPPSRRGDRGGGGGGGGSGQGGGAAAATGLGGRGAQKR